MNLSGRLSRYETHRSTSRFGSLLTWVILLLQSLMRSTAGDAEDENFQSSNPNKGGESRREVNGL